MKKSEIKVGGVYATRVAGNHTTVRVDAMHEVTQHMGCSYTGKSIDRDATVYDVTNLTTGRKLVFRSAAKFRRVASGYKPDGSKGLTASDAIARGEKFEGGSVMTAPQGDEQGSDPTQTIGERTKTSKPCELTSCKEGENRLHFAQPGTQTEPTRSATTGGTATPAAPPSSRSETSNSAPPAAQSTPSKTGLAGMAATAYQGATSQRRLTDEQRRIVDEAPTHQVLVIEAGAGCGKTSTLVELSGAMPGIGQYTAFNTSLVNESREKFSQRVRCNTIHSLAFGSVGRNHAHRLRGGRVRASEVAAMIGLGGMTVDGPDGKPKLLQAGLLATMVKKAVGNFCQSADKGVALHHVPRPVGLDKEYSRDTSNAVRQHLLPFAQKLWEAKLDVKSPVPFAHDDYVKIWELGDPYIAADYVLLDEGQDTSPVMLSIMEAQVRRGTRVILVGDSAQQIYSWRGAINALAAFPDAPRLMLSQSFRFGQVIAEVANAVLSNLMERTKLVMRGFDRINSKLATVAAPDCVLCRTNAGAVGTLLDQIVNGKKVHLIGGGDDAVAMFRAARDIKRGTGTQHPELGCFASWSEVVEFSKTDEGEDLKLMVKIIDRFGMDRILGALENMPSELEADLVVSTAHKSKGREWKKVTLSGDFPPLEKMDDEGVRLLYVAATRAQHVLDVEGCPPFIKTTRQVTDEGVSVGCDSRPVNLTTARRLSAAITGEAGPVAALPAPAPAGKTVDQIIAEALISTLPEQVPPPAAPKCDNVWTKGRQGDWLVRGKPGQSGTVSVVKKNGETSQETIKRQIWANTEVALYEVTNK